jgi:hypothetical protein
LSSRLASFRHSRRPRWNSLVARVPSNKPLKLTAAGFWQSCGFSPTRGVVASSAAAA